MSSSHVHPFVLGEDYVEDGSSTPLSVRKLSWMESNSRTTSMMLSPQGEVPSPAVRHLSDVDLSRLEEALRQAPKKNSHVWEGHSPIPASDSAEGEKDESSGNPFGDEHSVVPDETPTGLKRSASQQSHVLVPRETLQRMIDLLARPPAYEDRGRPESPASPSN